MADPMQTHGLFSWNELHARDPDKMRRFYSAVLGWKFDEMPMPGGTYSVIKVTDAGSGGVTANQTGQGGWLAYVTVNDVEAAVAKTTAAGGKVVSPPMDVPQVGRMATLADPEGALFAVIKYARQQS